MGNRYAGDGDAGPIEAFRDAGRDTYVEADDDGVRAGWAFPDVMDNDTEPTADSQRSLNWRIPVYVTVRALDLGDAVALLTDRLREAGIPFELE